MASEIAYALGAIIGIGLSLNIIFGIPIGLAIGIAMMKEMEMVQDERNNAG